jgi:hypothetical protein
LDATDTVQTAAELRLKFVPLLLVSWQIEFPNAVEVPASAILVWIAAD